MNEEDIKLLSEDQQAAWKSYQKGDNLFLTGPAGSGKSFLVQKMIQAKSKGVAVTASTGIAASLIGGTTLHYWAGIGLGHADVKQLIKMVSRKLDKKHNWTSTHTLFIDEVSMFSADLLDKLDLIGKSIRNDDRPFGGIQIILVGDFFQLPPVTKEKQIFCFESEAWKKAGIQTIYLRKIFRQKDEKFVDALGEIRTNEILSQETRDLLIRCSEKKLVPRDGILPTCLFCKRVDVAAFNKKELAKLSGPSYTFISKDNGPDTLISHFRYPKEMELRVGAQVLHLRNDIPRGLVNGSRGIVIEFHEDGLPVIQFENKSLLKIDRALETFQEHGRVIASREQLPLCLAWAITVHKSQGLTLERAIVNISGVFEYGQVYVALSRVQSAEELEIQGLDLSLIRAHPSAKLFYSKT